MKFRLKALLTLALAVGLAASGFSETLVKESGLAKELEKNTDDKAVFVCEMNLKKISIKDFGVVVLPQLAKSKAKIVAEMDMAYIAQRIAETKKSKFTATFEARNAEAKEYALTKIEGIPSAAQYFESHSEVLLAEMKKNISKGTVHIVSYGFNDLSANESNWLNLKVGKRLSANFKDYLGLNCTVFENDEYLRGFFSLREKDGYYNLAASDLGKFTGARYGACVKYEKTNAGYKMVIDFTDLLTGWVAFSCTSKDYELSDYLYSAAGAADEVSVMLADRLGLSISDASRNGLANGFENLPEDSVAKREKIAKELSQKAAGLRKSKASSDKKNVNSILNDIESKKEKLVAIRKEIEEKNVELFGKLEKDRVEEEKKIRERQYSTVELGNDGNPTEQAKQRRENQVIKSYEDLTNKFFADCDAVKKARQTETSSLLAGINDGYKALASVRTASSLGDDLKVTYGKYDAAKKGWKAYFHLYSDGVNYLSFKTLVSYETMTGKNAPDMEKEMDNAVIDEFTKNVEMYDSLLARGVPVISYEDDYKLLPESADNPSEYKVHLSKTKWISTATSKNLVDSNVDLEGKYICKNRIDLREFAGVVEKEKAKFDPEKYIVETRMVRNGLDLISVQNELEAEKKEREKIISACNFFGIKMVKIPSGLYVLNTEVTQNLYTSVMGSNPSNFKGGNNPVEMVSWYDAIYFCNLLSKKAGLTPVYSVNGTTDVSKWGYTPHRRNNLKGNVRCDWNANGFRLPSQREWESAAWSGSSYGENSYEGPYSEEDWNWKNSGGKTHPVAQKKPNEYGLYDMSGNVYEWVWNAHIDSPDDVSRRLCGQSWSENTYGYYGDWRSTLANWQYNDIGFRIVLKDTYYQKQDTIYNK